MKKFLFLFLIIFSNSLSANDKEVLIYKDFLQEPVSFSESSFLKSFKNSKDYKRFFNNFVEDREETSRLLENNSLMDVLNVCYLTYLQEDTDKYSLSKQEGKYCLYNLATSGVRESFAYIANYHFNEYKKILVSENRVDVNELIKVSYYFGLADSFSLDYELGNPIIEVNTFNFNGFIEDSLVKVNNKEVLRSYYNSAKLLSINLPLNSLVFASNYTNFFIDLAENYKNSFSEENLKIFDGMKKGNYRVFEKDMIEINEKDNEYLSKIDFKNISDIQNLCSDAIFGRGDFKIKSNIPEFCLSQLSVNELSSESSYDLALYFYLVAKNQTEENLINSILNKSVFWLAFSNELGHSKSKNLFKRILVENKENGFQQYIKEYNNGRKISKLLIDNKIKSN